MDIKVVLHPQGGLNLAKIKPAQLADSILLAARIRGFEADQRRFNTHSNFIVVITPWEERAAKHKATRGLACGKHEFAVKSHIPPPDTTVPGSRFQVPPDDD